MIKHRSHWTCVNCLKPGEAGTNRPQIAGGEIRVLNLYAGIGGNRKHWRNVAVTAVELNPLVAAAYKKLYPEDTVIVGDAHKFLLKNFQNFDIIWSSPPCQTHSRMNYWTTLDKKRYPDLSMYSEILLLQNFFTGRWVVENVDPYYIPLIPAQIKIGRHLFWSNKTIKPFEAPEFPGLMDLSVVADKKRIMDWLDIHLDENIYLSAKNPLQVFRNCVHPSIGRSVFNDLL
jgi:DNA (cytosine-5)-methyltransferase 1